MRVERRDGYRVVVGGPVPIGADAITLGRTIIMRRRSAHSEALMAHELVHVRQFADLGPIRFVVRYLRSYLRSRLAGYGHLAAYRRIPLEVEACWLSRLHRRSDLEPATPDGPPPAALTGARAPRLAATQRLRDQVRDRGLRSRANRSRANGPGGAQLVRDLPGPLAMGGSVQAATSWSARASTSWRRKRITDPSR